MERLPHFPSHGILFERDSTGGIHDRAHRPPVRNRRGDKDV